jgi:hypothetical protein
MNAESTTRIANYCGVLVEVIQVMKHYSLIRFDGRSAIVDTADLIIVHVIKRAA